MGSWHCLLLLLCKFSLVLTIGEVRKNYDDFDLVNFLKRISGLSVGGEPFIIKEDFEINSFKQDLSFREGVETKDKAVHRDPAAAPGPVVLTKDGHIRGVSVDKAHVFYGIPYADPPVGAYRWKTPRPVSPWAGVYDATFPRAACMQACNGKECPRTVRSITTSHLFVCCFDI